MAFGRRLIGKRQRAPGCKCCRNPHAGRPTGGMPLVADENNLLLADHLICDGGLLDLIEQMQAANLADPTIGMRTKKLKPVLAKQVATFAKARAKEIAQFQSPGERQAKRPHVAPLERDELVLGKLLGVGGFSHVYEIKSFDVSATTAAGTSSANHSFRQLQCPAGGGSCSSGSSTSSTCERLLHYTKEQRVARTFLSHCAVRSPREKEHRHHHHQQQQYEREAAKEPEESSIEMSDRTMTLSVDVTTNRPVESETGAEGMSSGLGDDDDRHQDMCRYAVKHLKPSLLNNPEKFAKAAMDLACEAELLLCLDHPNIVKLRGWSARGPDAYKSGEHSAYFLVIDRLVETLQDRVYKWRRQWKKIHRSAQLRNQRSFHTGITGLFMHCFRGAADGNERRTKLMVQRQFSSRSKLLVSQSGSDDDAFSSDSITKDVAGGPHHTKELGKAYVVRHLTALLVERLQVAHDIACALEYLHEKRIIYRDLKTANVGFDIRGNVKLYDFGLSRYLYTQSGDPDEAYIMSKVGTARYIAPEVSANRPYGLKADVYSFGVVLWEIFSMSSPQGGQMCPITGAVLEPKPPKACPCWPVALQNLVTRMLDPDYPNRPTMTHVRSSIEEIIRTLSDPESSMNMLEYTGDGAAPRLSMSPRRRSTFRLESFNMEELVGLKDLDAATATAEESSATVLLGNDRSLSSSFGASITSPQYD